MRYRWIDHAKTLAILLVVLGHVWRGVSDSGLMTDARLFAAVDTAIYYFHMPFFFMLSGFLFPKALQKPWTAFVTRQAETIIWPYVLWSLILMGTKAALGGSVNHPVSVTDIVSIPWEPFSIFWFLYVLFVIQMVAKAVIGHGSRKRDILLVTCAAAAFALHFLGLKDFGAVISGSSLFFLYFAMGYLIRKYRHADALQAFGNYASLSAVLWVCTALGLLWAGVSYESFAGRVAALLFCLYGISISVKTAHTRLGRSAVIPFVSSATLAIYCSHLIFTAGTRVLLTQLGVSSLWLHVLGGTFAGMAFPLLGYFIALRLGIARWAGLGRGRFTGD